MISYKQYPINIVLNIYTAMSGNYQYEITIDNNCSLFFLHNRKIINKRLLKEGEVLDLISVLRNLKIPFTSSDANEGHVCDGSSMELNVASHAFSFSISFYDGQDIESNKTFLDAVDFIEQLVDESDLKLTFGNL